MRLSKRIFGIALGAALVAAVAAPGPALARTFPTGTQIEFNGKSTQVTVQGYESFFRSMALWIVAEL